MRGESKALLTVGGSSIMDRLYGVLADSFEEMMLVTNEPLRYLSWDAMIVTDVFPVRSSLTGIHSALLHTSTPHAFITACDTPFLKASLVRMLLNELEPKWDVVIPVTEKGHQPLCAIYSRRCIKPIERQLRNGELKILEFFPKVRVKRIHEEQLRSADPDLVSFFNINTPEELAASERMLEEGLG